jgi:site-specific DNA-methyltransferase (adenine-specific)
MGDTGMSEINTYLLDCMKLMKDKPDKHYQLAIVDPPYARNGNMNGGGRWEKYNDPRMFDSASNIAPDKEYWNELFRVSENQIVWGGNYFPLGICDCFIIWDKQQPEQLSYSSVEFAWTSFQKRHPLVFRKSPMGRPGERFHPTQKPVKLYEFLLQRFAKPGDKILDTHGGSFSSAIACYNLGFDLDICEINEFYYNQAKARLEQHIELDREQLRFTF